MALAGPGHSPDEQEQRLAHFGARRELLDLIEHVWGAWETNST